MSQCCCSPSVTPAPTPNNPVGPLGPARNIDPTTAPTPASAGIDTTDAVTGEMAVSGRLNATVRQGQGTVSGANAADTIGGTVAGQAFGPVAVTAGDNNATAAAVAAALDALTGVTATSAGPVFFFDIVEDGSVGVDIQVTGAGGTAVALVLDAETCRLRIYRKRGGGNQLDGWQVLGAYGGGPKADYPAPFDIADGFAPIVVQLDGVTALYPWTSNLAGDDADAGTITYRAYATFTPLE